MPEMGQSGLASEPGIKSSKGFAETGETQNADQRACSLLCQGKLLAIRVAAETNSVIQSNSLGIQ